MATQSDDAYEKVVAQLRGRGGVRGDETTAILARLNAVLALGILGSLAGRSGDPDLERRAAALHDRAKALTVWQAGVELADLGHQLATSLGRRDTPPSPEIDRALMKLEVLIELAERRPQQ